MQNGKHINLPAIDAAGFRRDLLAQASDDDVELSISETPNADGTVNVTWTVLTPGTPPVLTPSVHPDIPNTPPAPVLDTPDVLPATAPGRFISARKTAPLTIVYIDAQGNEVLRQGGSRSWRNNNPGNIERGPTAAIGDDGRFAIFPDEAIGHQAIIDLLLSSRYVSLSLKDAIFKYAPPSENDSARYLAFVSDRTGILPGTIIESLSRAQLGSVGDVIKLIEGWTPGTERPNGPAAGTPGVLAVPTGVSAASRAAREWMDIADREAALPEHERSAWPDPGENPRILDYFRVSAAWFEATAGDETDWCAAFVNYCLVSSGHFGTDHPGARSFFWNKKGQFVRLDQPQFGAVAVIRRAPFDDPTWSTGPGHVAFVTSFTPDSVMLLGGNQEHSVNRTSFKMKERNAAGTLVSEVVAFMMPVMA